MITYVTGSLFESPAQVLVNTVNTIGVMGKGVALTFKKIYPEMFKEYQLLCENGEFAIGNLWLYKSPNKWILNFPTKQHWRNPSRVEYVEEGLIKFVQAYDEMGIHSIAFPPLGSGHGKLDFIKEIQPLMESYLDNLPIEIYIYPDRGVELEQAEHENIKEMRKWLHTEPRALSFTEVWEDLVQIIEENNHFETIQNGNQFSVTISNKPKGLAVIASTKKRFIPFEELLSFWQQLRTHGYTWRHIAPGISRELSYLIPIFSSLSYVKAVILANSYKKLNQSPVRGLQVLPTAFSKSTREITQLPLFEHT
jgi:O-acetyl-ADP-ribose deacetylase (regulator of RNase III)